MEMQMRLGVDIGGTKVSALVLDALTGQEHFKTKFSTPSSYETLITRLSALVSEAEHEVKSSVTYGMCYPGSIAPGDTVVQNSNILWLNGKAFESDLSQALARPIRAGNDANCFTLSEALHGAGRGQSVVFGGTLGTGLGGGVVIHGKLIEGRNKLAGEWGHNPLPWASSEELALSTLCYCGKKGCLESFLSGTGLSRCYQASGGESLPAEIIIQRAEAGEARALHELEKFEDRFARACAMVINLIDPDVIVLGGGLSTVKRFYENIPRQWSQYVFSPNRIQTQLLPAAFGPESGMRGAALL
jgi:fructokinase